MLRKFTVLAAVAVSALALVVVAAGAATTYRFKQGTPAGPATRSGTFGENFELNGTTSLAAGPATNTCNAHLSGQVKTNSTAGALTAATPGHTFSGCNFPTYSTGTWSLSIPQGQAGVNKVGTVNGVDVLLDLGSGLLCEFRGNPKVSFHNGTSGAQSFITLPPANTTDTLTLYTGTGTFTTNAGACPPAGNASGTLTVQSASNPTNNIAIG